MLTLWGKLYQNGKTVKADTFTSKKMPMWHTNHTKQLGLFRKATFRPDDFVDQFPYEKFEIQIIDSDEP